MYPITSFATLERVEQQNWSALCHLSLDTVRAPLNRVINLEETSKFSSRLICRQVFISGIHRKSRWKTAPLQIRNWPVVASKLTFVRRRRSDYCPHCACREVKIFLLVRQPFKGCNPLQTFTRFSEVTTLPRLQTTPVTSPL